MDARLNTRVAALVLLGLIFYGGRGGEAQDTSCLPALIPCSSYLNTTGTPDKTCCDGLISVIDKNAKCLCGLLNSTAVKQLGINITKALELPARCGKNVTADQCTKINGSGGAPTAAPTSGGTSSSPTPGPSPSSSPSGASSLVVDLFSSVFLAALLSVGLASQMLMGGGWL